MFDLWATTVEAILLLFSGNRELWEIVFVSLRVSLFAIVISTPIAFVLAFVLSQKGWRFKKTIISISHTLAAMPAVVIGLLVYLTLSKYGILGDLNWLFSQNAMIIGQILLAFPILLNIAHTGLSGIKKEAKETMITLGANRYQLMIGLMFECRFALLTAITTAFGRIIAEVGSAMMVGGNMLHYTRNITTAIALETSKGEFSQGIALGIVLLVLALIINFLIVFFNKRIT